MKYAENSNVIELGQYLPQKARVRRNARTWMQTALSLIEGAMTLTIGGCCVACLVLVFTML